MSCWLISQSHEARFLLKQVESALVGTLQHQTRLNSGLAVECTFKRWVSERRLMKLRWLLWTSTLHDLSNRAPCRRSHLVKSLLWKVCLPLCGLSHQNVLLLSCLMYSRGKAQLGRMRRLEVHKRWWWIVERLKANLYGQKDSRKTALAARLVSLAVWFHYASLDLASRWMLWPLPPWITFYWRKRVLSPAKVMELWEIASATARQRENFLHVWRGKLFITSWESVSLMSHSRLNPSERRKLSRSSRETFFPRSKQE